MLSGGTCCSAANSGHRELELQNLKFVAGRVLDEMELWSGPLGMVQVGLYPSI